MARLRSFVSYRRLERPYTRKSKYRKKTFIRASPVCKIIRFNMGDKVRPDRFDYKISLKTNESLQIRDNALESARQSCNRLLEKVAGKGEFYFFIRTYPHHFLRMNSLASGAGADRLSTGMKHAFGKVIGRAAQLRAGQTIFEVYVNKKDFKIGKEALKRASNKLPCPCSFVVEKTAQ